MDNEAQSLTVARQDMWNQTCPRYLYNTTLDFNLFSYAPNQQNITLPYGCIEFQGQTAIPYQFDCNVNGTASVSYFTSSTILLPSECNKSVSVPVNQTSGEALTSSSATVARMEAALAADQPSALTCKSTPSAHDSGFPSWLIVVLLAVAGIIVLSIVILCCYRRKWLPLIAVVFWKKETTDYENVEAFVRTYGSQFPKHYRYTDLKKMTNTFADKLGQGGYGSVFKGTLPDGHVVAVKLLSEAKGNGEEFINEVASMSRTSHVNVVKLLGFCFEGSKRALIYEFMPNSSLDKFICSGGSFSTSSCLDWETLYQIALGIARGLEYLHRGCNTRIVHFDIKPQNILLDEDFCPKISDFGLAKLCKRKESALSMMGARGTPGYIAPEIFCRNFGAVSHKSDVYSYGMMVLEMVGVRENTEVQATGTSEIYFPDWIFEQLEPGKDLRLNSAATEDEEETARKMILVSLWCIQTNPSERPTSREVVEMLEGSLQSLQIPPKPT
ncbi:hypothetical protein RJ640_011011 [Escallonia rubra]|uniref:Protein kinase domain-containing protein n=1 Tax=Escallonia rubra TaxID=112253 RepID=A0AA88RVZ5_9ASTE|nr:hypothetical protein RJ640_011011 [Escallonia rubra]